jgi:hypothetical protein
MFKISPSVEMTTYIGFTNPIFRLFVIEYEEKSGCRFVISTLGEIWLPICHFDARRNLVADLSLSTRRNMVTDV